MINILDETDSNHGDDLGMSVYSAGCNGRDAEKRNRLRFRAWKYYWINANFYNWVYKVLYYIDQKISPFPEIKYPPGLT